MSNGESSKRSPWEEVVHDIYSGFTAGTGHGLWFVKNWVTTNLIRPALRTVGIPGNVTAGAFREEKPLLKVVGVGFGRTGTYSLALALEELGYPTLHTQHMYENPAILDMWSREIFQPSIQTDQAFLGTPDFDLVASHGYLASADLPMALYFEQLMDHYPDSKFILTTRESSDVWFRSWDMLTRTMTEPTRHFRWMAHAQKLNLYYRWLFSLVNKDNSFLSAPFPLPNQERTAAIDSYEQHNRRVREVIPPERLLEYSVKEGWEPLCNFLDVPDCPTTPFPNSNSARSLRVQVVSAMVVPLAVTLFVLFYIFSVVFRKYTGKTVLQWLGIRLKSCQNALRGQILKQSDGRDPGSKRRGLKAE